MATRNAAKRKAEDAKRKAARKATRALSRATATRDLVAAALGKGKPAPERKATKPAPQPAAADPQPAARLTAAAIAALPSWAMCISQAARDGRLAYEAGQPATLNPFQVAEMLRRLGDGRAFDRLASAWLAGFDRAKSQATSAAIKRRNVAEDARSGGRR